MSTDNFGALGADFFIKTFDKGSSMSQSDLDQLIQYIQLTTTIMAVGDFTPNQQDSVWMILERVDVPSAPGYTVTNNTDVTMTSGGMVTIDSIPWTSVTGKPNIFSGSYNDLTDKPNQSLNTGNSVSFNRLTISGASGIEGGEIELAKAPTSTLAGNVIIDVYENKLRFFEGGGNGRGFYLDLTTGANNTSTNIMSGGSGSDHEAYEITNTSASGPTYSVSVGTDGMISFPVIDGERTLWGAVDEDFNIKTTRTEPGIDADISILSADDIWMEAGDDIDLKADGTVRITSDNAAAGPQWQFGTDGNITLPAGGTISEGGGLTGAIRLTPAGGANEYQALVIYPTVNPDGDHLHLTAGGGTTELYLGNDVHYVKLVDGGDIEVQASSATTATWTFDTAGNIYAQQALGIKVPDGVPSSVTVINSSSVNWMSNPMSNLATIGGTGSGLRVNVNSLSDAADLISIATAGTGYTSGDVITVVSGTSTANFTIAVAGRNTWLFGTDGGLTFPDATVQTTAYTGSGSANTGDITFSGGALRNPDDNTVRLESLDINQTASYNFTPQNGDYSTAVWNGTSITFNDPTSSVQQAIWALNNFSTIEIQINGQWQTVTSGGAYTPSLPQAQRLDLNQTAVGGPLNIDEVQIVINEGTSSYVEIDDTDFTVDVQDDIRMYANDRFVLSNRGVGESIEIQTNNEDYTWSFKADGNLQLPSGGDIINSSGASVLGGGTTLPTNASGYLVNDGSGNLSWAAGDGTFSGNYNDLTNKPTYRIAVTGSTGGPFGSNLQADSLALAGLNPTENIPSTYGGDLILQGGVGGANNDLYGEVRIKSGTIGANYEWHFTTDKKIKLPAGGDIVNSAGTSVLSSFSGSYNDLTNKPAPNYAQATGNATMPYGTSLPATVISGSITTNGGPVRLHVSGNVYNNAGGANGVIQFQRDTTGVGITRYVRNSGLNVPFALEYIDVPVAGTYTYSLKVSSDIGNGANFSDIVLTIIELK